MVREGSVKRKTPGVSATSGDAQDKKVRVAAPVKKVVKSDAPAKSSKAAKAAPAAAPKSKPAPVKAVLPTAALKKSKGDVEKAAAKGKKEDVPEKTAKGKNADVPEKAAAPAAKTSKPVKKSAAAVPAPAPGKVRKTKVAEEAVPAAPKQAKVAEEAAPTVPKRAKVGEAKKTKPSAKAEPKAAAASAKPLKSALAKPGAKKGKALRIHEAPASKGAEQDDDVDEDAGDEDDAALLAGFSDDDDEVDSDEEDEEDDALASRAAPSVDEVVRLPSSRDDAVVRQRLEQAKQRHAQAGRQDDTGVVYIGRLPHGFFEDQLRAYFSQFGDIRRLRVSRNKKTGHSKHYGFIEFESREVAEIVVDTMNNYLLDGHLIQMATIPHDRVDPHLWVGANRKFRRVPTDRVERVRRSRPRTDAERARVHKRLLQREAKRRAKLARAGIEYEFPGYQS
ncbi:nucleolar protein [Malassezia brasiliensis]|uniref:Nucleolar protein n=1 Tax=Malassezia brasiliensis TaxID=1821822 RepID=A0AAF0DUZ3_9BASI|nr:nucleolar protein [Malassezia brasiliensis]